MSTLFIDRNDTILNVRDSVLKVSTPGNDSHPQRMPLTMLHRIVIRANCQLDSLTIAAITEAGVPITILGGRSGERMAQIAGSAHNDARRRWRQALLLADPDFATGLARRVVGSKLQHQLLALTHLGAQRPDLRKPVNDAVALIKQRRRKLMNSDIIASLDQIRGVEGAAAASYYQAYFQAFAPRLNAAGRNRRPPRDPVNATLSLSYTLLASLATQACFAVGLDPALGALHSPAHGRAALACDLMEPLRPDVDLWVWNLFRSEILRPEHFGFEPGGACLLGKAGRSHYWPLWQQNVHRLRRHLHRYAMALVRGLGDEDVFQHLGQDGGDGQ